MASFSVIWSSSPGADQFLPYFSRPEVVEFPTEIPGQTAFALFYPPSNPMYKGSPNEKPPLLLKGHGKQSLSKGGKLL